MPKRTTGKKTLFVFLSFFAFFQCCWTQSRLSFEHYRITDGLSQSNVTCIVEDSQNQLWFGTQEGLNRFDGTSFEPFNRENAPAIKNAYFFDATKDANDDLWFGTRNGLLKYAFKKGVFTSYAVSKKSTQSIKNVAVLGPTSLLVLTSKQELYRFDKQKNRYSRITLNTPVKTLVKGDKTSFILGENNVIYKINKRGELYPWFNSSAPIHTIKFCNNRVFIFTSKGVFSINVSKRNLKLKRMFRGVQGSNISNITAMVYTGGMYYIATNQQGLYSFDERGKQLNYSANLFQANRLNTNNLNCLFLSKDKVLWVGSDRGVSCSMLSGSGFNTLKPSADLSKGLPCENVWSFSTHEKSLLIGTDLGITRYNPTTELTNHYFRSERFKTDASVMDIASINSDEFLLACYDGIYRFNPTRTNSFRSIPISNEQLSIKHAHFFKIQAYNKNTFLIGSSTGLLRMDLEKETFTEIHPALQDQVRAISTDSQGKTWVLYENYGLYQLIEQQNTFSLKPFKHNRKLLSLITDPLTAFAELNKGVFLFGTMGSGVVQISQSTGLLKSISKLEGLPNNTINSLIKDRKGNVWGSTNRGLICINSRGSLNSSIERRGIEPNEYNMNASFIDATGKLYFGGIFGLVYFNPNSVVNPSVYLYPKITRVTFLKKTRHFPSGFVSESQLKKFAYAIQLPYNARDFEIKFQSSQLYGAKHVTYKYVIIGEETDTILIGNTNKLTFNSLASGTYYLRLYSRYENGPWTDTPALLTVTINPPFWATIPFWFCVAAFLLLCAYIYLKYQVNRERGQRIKLEELVTKRTHKIQEQKEQIERKNEQISLEKEKVLAQQKQLFIEKERAEKWLNNALPSQAVKELNVQGKVSAKAYEHATILFTDVVGFSKISENITPIRLVNKLDVLFRKFDQIIKVNNLEKIKTIGDAYMAVGGLPDENSTHAIDACIAGLQIQSYMRAKKFDAIANHKDYWDIRLGINTGPVTAGIIGSLKMAYDVWGSAVNQAQRMEMLGQAGAVTISEQTFKLVEPYFECIHRGKAQMKSKVILDMYEVLRIKPELSLNGEGLKPNDLFYEIVGLHHYSSIKYYTAENELIQLLAQELPPDLSYHSLSHTKDVVKAVERIALLEGVRDEGLFLLKSAALFHDAGFVKQYEHNEPIGAAMAEAMLPKYGYNEQHIKTIKELIYVTQIPHKPVNKLQEIMCDADLDYLGTDSFEETANKLKIELMAKGKIQTDREWDQLQLTFLKQHKYFTQTAILTRDKKKKEHLKAIKKRFESNAYD
jgi:class 3 adenylate cyclase/ligand-binding sensor domain-containing protein/predicted metal-dependent HD superfamily phosphohydrolase